MVYETRKFSGGLWYNRDNENELSCYDGVERLAEGRSVMKKYSVLTKYINLLKNDNVGEWNCDKENDGSAERPIQIPFVNYSIVVQKLEDDIYKFAKESDEIVPGNYADILNANGIKWGYDSMIKADASVLDA